MTRDELSELFEKHSDAQFLGGTVKEPRDLQAFIKLSEIAPSRGDIVSAAEHDRIWLSTEVEELAKVCTEDDVIFLLNCGVFLDDDADVLSLHC